MNKSNILLICFLILGCASTSGRTIDQTKFSQIREGQTTKQEIINLFGKPEMTELLGNGITRLTYLHTKAKVKASSYVPIVNLFSSGMDIDTDKLEILIGENDIVQKYVFSDSSNEMNSNLFGTHMKSK